MPDEFQRIVEVEPAFDKRGETPNYGIKDCTVRFALKGPKGHIWLLVRSGWNLPEISKEVRQNLVAKDMDPYPMGHSIGYHSPTPQYEDEEPQLKECEHFDMKPCYEDCSYLRAQEFAEGLVKGGTAWLWPALEKEYRERYEPEPEEAA